MSDLSAESGAGQNEAGEIVVQYPFTIEAMLAARKWFHRTKYPRALRYLWRLLILFFLVAGVCRGLEGDEWGAENITLWAGAYLVFSTYILLPWLFRRSIQKSPHYGHAMIWRLGPDKIQLKTVLSVVEFLWAAIPRASRTPGGYVLFASDRIFYWLPREGFADEAEFDRLEPLVRQQVKRFTVIR